MCITKNGENVSVSNLTNGSLKKYIYMFCRYINKISLIGTYDHYIMFRRPIILLFNESNYEGPIRSHNISDKLICV
jgi:hypothetical protein